MIDRVEVEVVAINSSGRPLRAEFAQFRVVPLLETKPPSGSTAKPAPEPSETPTARRDSK